MSFFLNFFPDHPAVCDALEFLAYETKTNNDPLVAAKRYTESHRKYHGLNHLEYLFTEVRAKLDEHYLNGDFANTYKENLAILYNIVLLHDMIYDPLRTDNEEKSATWVDRLVKMDSVTREFIENTILSTKKCPYEKMEESKLKSNAWFSVLYKIFMDADQAIVNPGRTLKETLDWEDGIAFEFQVHHRDAYKAGRLNFIENAYKGDHKEALIEYIKNKKYKIGIYAGSFNPFHLGHYDVLKQADKLFDKVIVAQGVGSHKNAPENPITKSGIEALRKYHKIFYMGSTLMDLIAEVKFLNSDCEVSVVRGLRNGDDLAFEINQLKWVRDLYDGEVNFVFFYPAAQYEHVSSSALRDLQKYPDLQHKLSRYVP